jgi:hypothetical protein
MDWPYVHQQTLCSVVFKIGRVSLSPPPLRASASLRRLLPSNPARTRPTLRLALAINSTLRWRCRRRACARCLRRARTRSRSGSVRPRASLLPAGPTPVRVRPSVLAACRPHAGGIGFPECARRTHARVRTRTRARITTPLSSLTFPSRASPPHPAPPRPSRPSAPLPSPPLPHTQARVCARKWSGCQGPTSASAA